MDDDTEVPEGVSSPVQPSSPESKRTSRREWPKRKKMIMFIFGGAILALLIGGGLYWFLLTDGNNKNPTQTKAPTQKTQPQPTPTAADPTPVTFKSTKLNLELTHRKDWKMKETSDGEMTITSPPTSYTAADGQSGTGVFTVKIRKGVSEAAKATLEKSVASKDSEVIAYASPTEQQRQYTNVTYVGDTKEVFNMFIVTGSTELKAGNAMGYSLALSDDFYLIVGGYGAGGSDLSFEPVPKEFMESGALTQAIAIVESIKIF